MTKIEPLLNLSAGASGCLEATYQFVVDVKGYPVGKTVSLLSTNNRGWATAARDDIAMMQFEPAQKGGAPVAQLYDHTFKLQYTASRSGASPSRRPPPC